MSSSSAFSRQAAAPSRLDVATVRRSLEAKGIPLSRLSDANLRQLGLTREDLEGKAPKAAPKAPKAAKPRATASKTSACVPPEPVVPVELLTKWAPAWISPERLAFKLRLDRETPSNNVLRKLHFTEYKKLREAFAHQVGKALGGYAGPRLELSGVLVVRYASGEELDWDNAVGGLKPLLDCLVAPSSANPDGHGVMEDDCPRYMPVAPHVLQVRVPRGQEAADLFVYRLA